MSPDIESLIKELESFVELFNRSAREFNDIGFYDRELMAHLVFEVQKRAAAVSRKLENENE